MTGVLAGSAFLVGVVHTLAGPDHYVPFMALSRARGWTLKKTLLVTAACGLGHVASSVIIVLAALGLGLSLDSIEIAETFRGDLAGWLLLGFGLAYTVWGLKVAARRGIRHEHEHVHPEDGDAAAPHVHKHDHSAGHVHLHPVRSGNVTPWVMFLIFFFGPCEPMIPLVFLPAASGHAGQALMVSILFGIATISTMLVAVGAASTGLARIRSGFVERYGHAMAGGLLTLCGVAIKLGL
jgi:ABC-type nickel/cobalt efflux system permease component RcnA